MGLLHRVGLVVAAGGNAPHVRPNPPQFSERRHPTHPEHRKVKEHTVHLVGVLPEDRHRFLAVRRDEHREPQRLQHVLRHGADDRFVVNDEYRPRRCGVASGGPLVVGGPRHRRGLPNADREQDPDGRRPALVAVHEDRAIVAVNDTDWPGRTRRRPPEGPQEQTTTCSALRSSRSAIHRRDYTRVGSNLTASASAPTRLPEMSSDQPNTRLHLCHYAQAIALFWFLQRRADRRRFRDHADVQSARRRLATEAGWRQTAR